MLLPKAIAKARLIRLSRMDVGFFTSELPKILVSDATGPALGKALFPGNRGV
jgi:hypothetical protein